MWHLTKIKAQNVLSFKECDFEPDQGVCTLVTGVNKDSDNQAGGNGSGKSSIMEMMSLGILGSPLRKCNSSEVINDQADSCSVLIELKNYATNQTLTIVRSFFVKLASTANIMLETNGVQEEVKLSGVAEYNKFILDMLGLTREEILNNFILSKYQYKNFLSISDKDKKEIINTFSNGNKIDEAIELIKVDRDEANIELQEKTNTLSGIIGKIEAYADQIETINQSSEQRRIDNERKIGQIKANIESIKQIIKSTSAEEEAANNKAVFLDEICVSIEDIEKSGYNLKSIQELEDFLHHDSVFQHFNKDYSFLLRINELNAQYDAKKVELSGLKSQLTTISEEVDRCSGDLKLAESQLKELTDANAKEESNLKVHLSDLESEKRLAEDKLDKLEATMGKTKRLISSIDAKMHGAITCPKCSHQFLTNQDASLEDLKASLNSNKALLEDTKSQFEALSAKLKDDFSSKILIIKNKLLYLHDNEKPQRDVVNQWKSNRSQLDSTLSQVKSKIAACESSIESFGGTIEEYIKKCFDNTINDMADLIEDCERIVDRCKKTNEANKSTIKSYTSQIEAIQGLSDDDSIKDIESKIEVLEEQKDAINEEITDSQQLINKLTEQESVFVKYKTYLANTKISALSTIINEFLDEIGSDLKVKFSGFTVLASGKIRDKISITLTRDGVDIGSFGKLSVGEQARINLACILALNKLVNINCDENKGLNLLVLDEVIDGTDESGISSILEALNNTGLTCLLITHGKTSESYSPCITVVKSQGNSNIKME